MLFYFQEFQVLLKGLHTYCNKIN